MPKRTLRRGKGKNKSKGKRQRLYNMKGCSKTRKQRGGYGCGAYGCPLAPFSWKQMQQRGGKTLRGGEYTNVMNGGPILGTAQNGGTCDTCSAPLMTGGSFYKPAAPMPGPFIGQAWSPSIKGWPGVDGVSNNRNYLENNLYNRGDPQTMMKLGGSKRKKSKSMNKRGGGLIPQDMVNLGRDLSFNFKSAYNALNGYSAPVSPLPYKDQLSGSMSANRIII
jgi:hypothetical protein